MPKFQDHIILDPFAGSGTTLVDAQQLGYHFIGIEIEAEYVEIIKKRLSESQETISHEYSSNNNSPNKVSKIQFCE